jgi:uncharacterized membrane protein
MSYNSQSMINPQDQERTLKGLKVNTAALLCYLGVWISGIIFLVLEQKNRFIRFHALQSIITFGILSVAGSILDRFPVVGGWLSGAVSVAGFILWIILMVKAGQGELFKLPWIGDLAERLAHDSMPEPPPPAQTVREEPGVQGAPASSIVSPQSSAAQSPPVQPLGVVPPAATGSAMPPAQPTTQQPQGEATRSYVVEPPAANRSSRSDRPSRAEAFRAKYYSMGARAGRIVGSSFAIAWAIALVIFFNYFHQYIAYYHAITTGGSTVWEVFPLVTGAFENWLPIATTALLVTIIGHALMIVYDRYLFRQAAHLVIDLFSLASIITLVAIFPFDFSPIPNTDVVQGLEIGLPIGFILIAVGIGIGVLVRFITMIVHLAESKY